MNPSYHADFLTSMDR